MYFYYYSTHGYLTFLKDAKRRGIFATSAKTVQTFLDEIPERANAMRYRTLTWIATGAAFLISISLAPKAFAYDPAFPFTCENYPAAKTNYIGNSFGGTDLLIPIPPNGWIEYYSYRIRAEASRIIACKSVRENMWSMAFAGQINTNQKQLALFATVVNDSPGVTVYSSHASNRFRLSEPFSIHDPWDGVGRYARPWGVEFEWFDSAGPTDPNTIVYACVFPSNVPCPYHRLKHKRRVR